MPEAHSSALAAVEAPFVVYLLLTCYIFIFCDWNCELGVVQDASTDFGFFRTEIPL